MGTAALSINNVKKQTRPEACAYRGCKPHLARVGPGVIQFIYGLEVIREASKEKIMVNSLLPPEERNLTAAQVEALDKRRDLGHTFLVIAGQFTVIAAVLLLWVGQDLTYSPGWAHPMAYYFAIVLALVTVFGIAGLILRRGTPRID